MAAGCRLRNGPRREKLRRQAAQMSERDIDPVQVARQLRVSPKSVYQWRRRWRAGGPAALASKGAGGAVCRLTSAQLAKLRAALDGGPTAWGWSEDRRWTLARVTAVIGRLFHVQHMLRGTSCLLHRIGFSPQLPVHRAAERDEDAIAGWRAVTWARLAAAGAWTRPGRPCARRRPVPGPAAATPRWSRCPARAPGWSRWPGWCA